TAEDLAPDREVPVAERRPASGGVGAERAAAQHLVARAEEDFGVLAVRPRAEAGVAAEVARRPLPDVTDQLPYTVGRLACRIGAGGCGLQVALAQVGMLLGGIVVAPGIAAGTAGVRVVPGGLLPPR